MYEQSILVLQVNTQDIYCYTLLNPVVYYSGYLYNKDVYWLLCVYCHQVHPACESVTNCDYELVYLLRTFRLCEQDLHKTVHVVTEQSNDWKNTIKYKLEQNANAKRHPVCVYE